MVMPNGDNLNAAGHTYGFNGQMNDAEFKGAGNSLDFGARIYDPRLGRFLSRDPKSATFNDLSPYHFAVNNPIRFIDENGEYSVWRHYLMTKKALLKAGFSENIAREIAHYASVYADAPSFGVQLYNTMMMKQMGDSKDVQGMLRNIEKYGSYDELKDSQSGDLIKSATIHAMMTYWEHISEGEAVKRALEGGDYIGHDGEKIHIEGALNVILRVSKRNVKDWSIQDKKDLGLAFHTIQDAEVHQGGRWVGDFEDEAEKLSNTVHGHQNGEWSPLLFNDEHVQRHSLMKDESFNIGSATLRSAAAGIRLFKGSSAVKAIKVIKPVKIIKPYSGRFF